VPSVPACCSEYGKARGSKGLASYFTCDRATHVGRCTFAFACWLLHVASASCGGADLTALRGMPNSRRYSFPFVRSHGTALRSGLRLLFERSRHMLRPHSAPISEHLRANDWPRQPSLPPQNTAAHSHRHAPPQ
jgi:hypothetical protein